MDSMLILIAVAAAYLLAGFVKGVIGMGLPTVAIGLSGLVMTPAQAAAILVVPSLVTNIWQIMAGGALIELAQAAVADALGVCIGTFIGAVDLPQAAAGRRLSGSAPRLRSMPCLAWSKSNSPCRRSIRNLARPSDRHRHRCGDRRHRRLRAAGRSLSAGAENGPAQTGAGARAVLHGFDRHLGACAATRRRDQRHAALPLAGGPWRWRSPAWCSANSCAGGSSRKLSDCAFSSGY